MKDFDFGGNGERPFCLFYSFEIREILFLSFFLFSFFTDLICECLKDNSDLCENYT